MKMGTGKECSPKLKSFAKKAEDLYISDQRTDKPMSWSKTSYLALFRVKTKSVKQKAIFSMAFWTPDNCPYEATISGLALLTCCFFTSQNEVAVGKVKFLYVQSACGWSVFNLITFSQLLHTLKSLSRKGRTKVWASFFLVLSQLSNAVLPTRYDLHCQKTVTAFVYLNFFMRYLQSASAWKILIYFCVFQL